MQPHTHFHCIRKTDKNEHNKKRNKVRKPPKKSKAAPIREVQMEDHRKSGCTEPNIEPHLLTNASIYRVGIMENDIVIVTKHGTYYY